MNSIANLGIGGGLSVFQNAQLGINRALGNLAQNAQTIAHANVDHESTGDVTAALVDSLEQKLLVQLSARMLTVADQTLGTLLDVKA